jgi:hypothetical protein
MLWSCIEVLFILVLTGCDRNDYLKLAGYSRVTLQQRNTPQFEDSLAKLCTESLRQARYEDVIGHLDPSVVDTGIHDKLVAIAKTFPNREPISFKTFDSKRSSQGDATITVIDLEYGYAPIIRTTGESTESIPGSWVFVENVIKTVGGSTTITGIKVQPSSESVESINAFTFANKGYSQYAALLLAVLLSAFTVYVVVLCIRANIGSQKWLWMLLILINVGHASIDWTTGQWSFTPLSIHYGIPPTPANMSCSAYGPWMMDLSLPLGALAFLQYLRRRTSRAKLEQLAPLIQQDAPHNR